MAKNHLVYQFKISLYEYDFGDGWVHEVLLEGILLKTKGVKYPICMAGERACPPEDCGSIPGYYSIIDILQNPNHEEYEDTVAWLKGHAKSYSPFDPEAFSPEKVRFENPARRWKDAFDA